MYMFNLSRHIESADYMGDCSADSYQTYIPVSHTNWPIYENFYRRGHESPSWYGPQVCQTGEKSWPFAYLDEYCCFCQQRLGKTIGLCGFLLNTLLSFQWFCLLEISKLVNLFLEPFSGYKDSC